MTSRLIFRHCSFSFRRNQKSSPKKNGNQWIFFCCWSNSISIEMFRKWEFGWNNVDFNSSSEIHINIFTKPFEFHSGFFFGFVSVKKNFSACMCQFVLEHWPLFFVVVASDDLILISLGNQSKWPAIVRAYEEN